MTFKHDGAQVVVELDAGSDEVSVSLDCEGLDFEHTSDPAALIEAGVPQPRSYVFLQREIPRPREIQDEAYESDECHFKSPLALQAAFDFYGKELKVKGWRESRKPIVTDDRRYTEFKRGPITLSVNIFSDEVGSRIILGYENPAKEAAVAPLPAVAGIATKDAAPDSPGAASDESQAKTAVDVSKNSGSATVTLGRKKYVFKHAAAYRTKDDGDQKTNLIFSERALPLQRIQKALSKDGDFSFSDLYEFDFPGHLTITLNGYTGFSFNAGGVGIGDSLDDAQNDIKVEAARVQGTIKMREAKEFFDDKFLLTATIDAAVITPDTRLGGAPARESLTARKPKFPDSELLLPEGAGDVFSEGTKYCKSTRAAVDTELKAVAEFFRKELTAQGWKEVQDAAGQETGDGAAGEGAAGEGAKSTLVFKKPGGVMTVKLAAEEQRTRLDITFQDDAKAKKDGILPEPGKARLVMVNGHTRDAAIAVGKQNYTLKAGRGTTDPKKALNYSVAPGTYSLTIKVQGKPPQTESLKAAAGEVWGVFVLPTGEYLTNRMYWSTREAE